MLDKILIKEVIAPIIIILSSLLIYFVIKRILKRVFKIRKSATKKEKTIYSLINNIVKWFIIIIAFLMILDVFGVDTKTLVASLGVLGLVVGLALQDILKDFISGLFIIFENQYCIGDVIEVKGFKGEVINLGLKTTRVRSYTGEVKIIPNRNVEDVINYSQMSSLAVVDVSVAYEENYDRVEKIVNNLLEKLNKKKIPNVKGDIKLLGITKLGDSSIEIRIVVETASYEHFEVERILRKEIKLAFDKENIKIPYPQIEVHNGKRI